jgi:hypothetical protein
MAATRVGTSTVIAVVSTVVGGATSTLVDICDGKQVKRHECACKQYLDKNVYVH